MKFRRIICLWICIFTLLGSVSTALAAQDPSVETGCRSVDAVLPLGGSEKILETANAVVVFDRNTGCLIYGYNMDIQIYPSSMVKLMTAILALQKGDLDEVVTVTRTALESVGIGVVSANLVRGEEITLRDLLYCMMVGSANDASAVIAEHIAGSQESFAAMMNEAAAEMGLTGTHFTNAHGLHDSESYTTARDVLKILQIGLENPEFESMFQTLSYTVGATNKSDERVLTNTNKMMDPSSKKYYDERVTGGKTGATDQAGRCLAVSANVADMELVAIVMGAKAKYSEDGSYLTRYGSFEEMAQLLDYVQDNFECRQLFYENQVITQYKVDGGSSNVVVTPADEAYSVVPKGITMDDLTWSYAQSVQGLAAPILQGQAITTMQVWYGDVCLAQTELLAMTAVKEAATLTENRITEDEKAEEAHGEILAQILSGACVLVIVGIVVFFLFRILQNAMLKARVRRRKRRRRNRNA